MKNSEVAILILAGNPGKYVKFIEALKSGWCMLAQKRGFKVFFYSGGHVEDGILFGNEIRVKESDNIHNCYRKFIAAKNVLLKNHPDIKLIFRTNVSSFIDIDIFEKYLYKAKMTPSSIHGIKASANKYSEKFFRYRLIHLILKKLNIGPQINFWSGAGLFIGVDICNFLKYNEQDNYLIDDVEIGFQVLNFTSHDLPYERIYVTADYKKINAKELRRLTEENLLFHYKFKTNDRNNDAYLLNRFTSEDFRISYLAK